MQEELTHKSDPKDQLAEPSMMETPQNDAHFAFYLPTLAIPHQSLLEDG